MGKLATCRAVSKTYPYNNPHGISIFNKRINSLHSPTEVWKFYVKYNHTARSKFTDSKSWLTLKTSRLLIDSDDLWSDWLPLGSDPVSSSIKAPGPIIWKQTITELVTRRSFQEPLNYRCNFGEFYLVKIWELNLSKWRTWPWCLHKQRRSQWICIIRGKPLRKLFLYAKQLILVNNKKIMLFPLTHYSHVPLQAIPPHFFVTFQIMHTLNINFASISLHFAKNKAGL